MRLNTEVSITGSVTTLIVTGVIDWSTIARFSNRLSTCASGPRPDLLVDLSGMLSWSPEAQAVLARAALQARLMGGQLAVFGLAPVPAWQASGAGLSEPSMSGVQARALTRAAFG